MSRPKPHYADKTSRQIAVVAYRHLAYRIRDDLIADGYRSWVKIGDRQHIVYRAAKKEQN
jgi:hypothetical protein